MALLLLIGLAFANALPSTSSAQSKPTARPVARDSYAAFIAEAASRFRVPAAWIRAVLRAESAGDVRAISRKGAMGLMQIMPDTWAYLRARHRLGADPYDPHDNIIAGAGYIRELFDRYGSPGWIAAYNAGPGRYEDSLKGRALPAETRAYVAIVSPAIGSGNTANPIVVASIDPFAWTRAPLFVAQAERKPAADSVSAGGSTDTAPDAPSVRDVSAIAPQSDGLFVVRAGGRNAP
jgi:soluble lytic murein transglycosylase-like protein